MQKNKDIPTQKTIFEHLGRKYNINKSIVAEVCRSPFVFAASSMANNTDERTLMFAYLCKIRLLKKFRNKKEETAIGYEQERRKYRQS